MEKDKSCGTIVVDGDKVLLVQSRGRSFGEKYWGFPKGHQEPGEGDIETALRETREEVSLEVEITDYRPIKATYMIFDNAAEKSLFLFIAKPASDSKKIAPQPGEISQTKWVTFAEAEELLTAHNVGVWEEFKRRYNK